MPRAPDYVRVFLTTPGGEALALYAERPTDTNVITLAYDYPDLPDVVGWVATGRAWPDGGRTVSEAAGRTLTLEVTP